jgi:hypothetical protein
VGFRLNTRLLGFALSVVMPGLVPGIHVLLHRTSKTWMAGTTSRP